MSLEEATKATEQAWDAYTKARDSRRCPPKAIIAKWHRYEATKQAEMALRDLLSEGSPR